MSDSTLSKEPTFSWMIRHPARILALGFGSGLLVPAPGTWGTVFAWVTWALFLQNQSVLLQGIVVVLTFALGGWACHLTGKHLGVADHSAMVIDEVVAFWLILLLVPSTLLAQWGAFLLFRLFDILKPQPIRCFDTRWKHGFGVMFDDVFAGFYALLVFALWQRFFA